MSETVDRLAIGEGRRLLRGLRDLADVRAPAGLLGAVLAGTGLADAYWEMDSPIGRIYVAYSGLGISAVMQAEDAAGFERAFAAHTGRPSTGSPGRRPSWPEGWPGSSRAARQGLATTCVRSPSSSAPCC